MPFPLPFVPAADYHRPSRPTMHARWFGAPRDGGRRLHAACDLLAPLGTPVYAIEDGIVDAISPNFYRGTGAIAIRHRSGIVARYCEVIPDSIRGMEHGHAVKSGQIIAKVGKMLVDSMLHFELYSGAGAGALSTHRPPSPYNRRADLIDPTSKLDALRSQLQRSSVEVGSH